MKTDAEKFYTERKQLLRFTIDALNYLPALRELWRKNLEFHPKMKILDVGCGTGALTKTLYEVSRQIQVTPIKFCAFDLTQTLLNEFQRWIVKKNQADVNIIKADVRKIEDEAPIYWRNFDLVCSSGVLGYLEERELKTALWKIRTRIKDGGRLIVMESREHWLNRILIQKLYKANLYGKEKFADMLHQAGFRNIRYWQFPKLYSYLNLWGYIAVAEK